MKGIGKNRQTVLIAMPERDWSSFIFLLAFLFYYLLTNKLILLTTKVSLLRRIWIDSHITHLLKRARNI